ncbi:MAG: hypothetical protein GYA55_00880 [SAR324 cluster bacterium]|uniref:Uncharacterized protein n=1 Tax=SAR324 cluster bacterium TaxID=2024889 RepID=A0A7X9FP98_9DELT|nr:hypothetical protein [SAR324 cluster bacterium]
MDTCAKLKELIKGKRDITTDTALNLCEVLKTSREPWLSLQSLFDHAQAKGT